MAKTRYVVWLVPLDAAQTIRETLEMDANSGAFDSDLREEISDALESIKEEGFTWLRPFRKAIKGLLDVL